VFVCVCSCDEEEYQSVSQLFADEEDEISSSCLAAAVQATGITAQLRHHSHLFITIVTILYHLC